MTAETIQHLNRIEQVIEHAKPLLGRHGYPDDLRTVVVIAFISQIVEHHEAMLLLIRNEKVGSAFVLSRVIFESMCRGLWVNVAATDVEIQEFERDDEIPLNMTQMVRAIDQHYRAGNFFEDFKNRAWPAMCSYAHTGLLQLGRRFTGHNVQPSYTDAEIVEATTTATTCVLLLAGRFLVAQGHPDESCEVDALIQTYGPAAQRNAAP